MRFGLIQTVPTPIWFENRSLTLAGSLGVVGRSGWFMPQYALDALPNLASFRGFKEILDPFFFFQNERDFFFFLDFLLGAGVVVSFLISSQLR